MRIVVEVTAKPEATKRTKERVKWYGPHFVLVARAASVIALKGRPGLLLQSSGGWLGWIPEDEISRNDIL